MRKSFLEKIPALARKYGAREAKLISPQTVVTAPWVRIKCQFGCGGYGGCLTCPPYSPTPSQTQEILAGFKKAILIHGDEHSDMRKIVARLERETFLAGYYKAFGMGAGPCSLGRTCDVEEGCRYPEEARPSMEAAGIDVFQTARRNHFPIKVLTSQRCGGDYYGLLLVE